MEVLYGQSIVLRPLQKEYFNAYLRAFSPLVRQLLHVSKLSSEAAYLYHSLERQSPRNPFYCIFDRTSDDVIGAIQLRDRDTYHGQLYCWINEGYWGTTYFKQALELVMHHYFEDNAVLYINAHVDSTNARAYQALRKCGFADCGIYKGPHGKQYQLIKRRK